MAFTIPEGLHSDLNPLAWLVGTWRGKGRGEYPNIEGFEYAHEVVFNHDGRPFLNYYSRSWIIDSEGEIIRPAASETGFWRVKPNNLDELIQQRHRERIQLILRQSFIRSDARELTRCVPEVLALQLPCRKQRRARLRQDHINAHPL